MLLCGFILVVPTVCAADERPIAMQAITWISQDTEDRGLLGLYGAPLIRPDASRWSHDFLRRRLGAELEQRGYAADDPLTGPLTWFPRFTLPKSWAPVFPLKVNELLSGFAMPKSHQDWDDAHDLARLHVPRGDVAFGAFWGGLLLRHATQHHLQRPEGDNIFSEALLIDGWSDVIAAATLEDTKTRLAVEDAKVNPAIRHFRNQAETAFTRTQDMVQVERALAAISRDLIWVERAKLFMLCDQLNIPNEWVHDRFEGFMRPRKPSDC